MKKWISAAMAVILMFLMAACSEETVTDAKADAKKPQKTEQHTEEKKTSDVVIQETVLLNEAGLTITAKSFDVDEWFGPELKLLIENNSGKNLTVQSRNASVNGYMVETMMSVDVADGKKANDALAFMQSDLESCGIDTIADMEFSFHVFTTEDWETYFDSEQIRIETSAVDSYAYGFDDAGDVLYDEGGVRIIVKGMIEDEIFGPGIRIYIENTSGENITIQARDVSVSGFMIDPIFSCDVMAEKRAVSDITFMTSDLEDNDINDIEEVELSFHIFNMEDWETIVDTDSFNITF